MAHNLKDTAIHAGLHLAKHALETDTGKQAVAAAATTAVVVGKAALASAVVAPILPVVAAAGIAYGVAKLVDEL